MHKVVIVGRPNVGKSSLFNRLIGRRAAVVADEPGVTRDVKEEVFLFENHRILLMDTGGLWSGDVWEEAIRVKAEMAIDDADVVLFAVEGRAEITTADYEVAEWLRRLGKPVVLVVTKIDSHLHEQYLGELYGLGFGEPFPTSAEHARGLDELMEHVVSLLPEDTEDIAITEPIRIALIGRPNVGKSSLLNAITGSERVIVSEIAGTTRDAIDIDFDFGGQAFVLVDTAGIRHRPADNIELFSQLRSERAIENSHVILLVIDPQEFGDHELKLANKAYDAGKPVILVINKWDLVPDEKLKSTVKDIDIKLNHLAYAPRVYTSAINEYGIHDLLAEATKLFEKWQKRVSTGEINRWLEVWQTMQRTPNFKGKSFKMFFGTQAEVAPPTFVIFCNRADYVTRAYEGYLKNRIREDLSLEGVPVRLVWRERGPRPDKVKGGGQADDASRAGSSEADAESAPRERRANRTSRPQRSNSKR
ncbi:MAG TPA: ribosome biogenesis GTPase Der [Deinococcales bacterium]|nr:ribosome biogenesis GTPase Der [Deinococcales bacterium]